MSSERRSFEARVEQSIADSRRAAERARVAEANERQLQQQEQADEKQRQWQERHEAQQGLQLRDIFTDEEVQTCQDFLAYMAKNSYPRITKLYVPPAQKYRRNLFGFVVDMPNEFSVNGYPLQVYSGSVKSPLKDVAYLCADARIRFADSASFGLAMLKNIPPSSRGTEPVVGFHANVQDGWIKRTVPEAYWHGEYTVDEPTYRHDFHPTALDTYLTRVATLAVQ